MLAWKDKINEKEAENGPFNKTRLSTLVELKPVKQEVSWTKILPSQIMWAFSELALSFLAYKATTHDHSANIIGFKNQIKEDQGW